VGGLGFAEQHGAVLGAVRIVGEGLLRAPQPRPGDGGAGFEAVVLVEPHRALACPPPVVELVVDGVGALAGIDAVVEVAEPPGGVGQQREPGRLLPALEGLAGGRGGVVRLLPVVTVEGNAR
jgi:hypothetical protein